MRTEPKDRPIQQGDDGDFLFVIETGSLEGYIKDRETGNEKMVKRCEAGDAFGELALLYNCPRAASVEACEKCVLLSYLYTGALGIFCEMCPARFGRAP